MNYAEFILVQGMFKVVSEPPFWRRIFDVLKTKFGPEIGTITVSKTSNWFHSEMITIISIQLIPNCGCNPYV